MISARKAKHLDATTMFTFSHANTPLGQSESAYYLSYFINGFCTGACASYPVWCEHLSDMFLHFKRSARRGIRAVMRNFAETEAPGVDLGGGCRGCAPPRSVNSRRKKRRDLPDQREVFFSSFISLLFLTLIQVAR